jgi:hypothetical protein
VVVGEVVVRDEPDHRRIPAIHLPIPTTGRSAPSAHARDHPADKRRGPQPTTSAKVRRAGPRTPGRGTRLVRGSVAARRAAGRPVTGVRSRPRKMLQYGMPARSKDGAGGSPAGRRGSSMPALSMPTSPAPASASNRAAGPVRYGASRP